MEFKEKFIERYTGLTDFKEFQEAISQPARKSIRVNTIKISVKKLESKISGLKNVPWCDEGFYIERRETAVGNLREHFLGYFYVQEAASMIPALILDPEEEDLVLDMSAAPGSKTTQLASLMKNRGAIIANDIKWDRIKALSMNLQRCGVSNTIITIYKGEFFPDVKFDKILLDAPCSGTGTLQKSPDTLKIYNTGMIKKLSYQQKRMILKAYSLLKRGGSLVYSTCSLEPEENENVVDCLLEKTDARLEKASLQNLKSSTPVLEFEGKKYNSEIKKCLRIWPQDNNSEGFFIAKIKKP
ncbi:RsmB/NOP family class I SAM-dependent RNA methyltransferase [Candidatus Woesearchaeota archaeon]|nr:RsmB/NOP family class I SAM-dependent RNA methyltransferase [Candidatus Woesearchaeota archaeon]